MVSVTFLLPWTSLSEPIGGLKVVFTYANGLVRRGCDVAIVQPVRELGPRDVKGWIRSAFDRSECGPVAPTWFPLDRAVAFKRVPSLRSGHVRKADALIATGWQTAEYASMYPSEKGRRLYLVYDYEYYMSAPPAMRARMDRTYRGDFRMLASSPVVRDVLVRQGVREPVDCPNGVELDEFGVDVPISDARRRSVGFPIRPESFKGADDAIRALSIIRTRFGDELEYWCYGWQPTNSLPGWVRFHRLPENGVLRQLLNATAVFMVPSHYEGWGLPGAEAMACGAALVSTDNGGCRVYAEHERTALLSPPRDPAALATNALRLLEDRDYAFRLAAAGHAHIQTFDWETAIDRFHSIIQATV
jgi:glycosyltransferase involved in cell wall biosynthesis